MRRLTSTYYVFGCKKYICKNCQLRSLYGCTAGLCVAYNKKICVNFSMLLEGDTIRYGLDSFYYCNKYLTDKNVSMVEKRLDVKQKYTPGPIILSNQPTCFLEYKHRMYQVLNLCGGVDILNKVNDLIKKGKCVKCNDYVSLENDNHVSTYVVHNNNGNWKIVYIFCSNAYPFEGRHKKIS